MATYRVLYTFRDKVTFLPIEAEIPAEAIEKASLRNPQIKTIFRAERVYEHKAVQEELSFTWTQEVANFFVSLLSQGRFYIEGKSSVSREIEDKYRELTTEILVPEEGVYNIAPDQKWGVEGSIYFDPTVPFPEDFGIEPEKPGQVNSTSLFWMLIRMGFRLSGNHKEQEIRNAIPSEFQQVSAQAESRVTCKCL